MAGVGVSGGGAASVLAPSVLPSQRDLICCVLALDNTLRLSWTDAEPRTLTAAHDTIHHYCVKGETNTLMAQTGMK